MPVVRPAKTEDAEAILAVWVARDVADTGAPDYTLDDVNTDLAAEHIDVLVAEDGEDLVAVAALERTGCMAALHPDREDDTQLQDALLGALEERARALGIDTMRVHLSGGNRSGIEHLRRAGYAPAFFYVKLRAEPDALPESAPVLDGLRSYAGGDAEDRELFALIDEAFRDIPGQQPSTYEQFRVEVVDRPSFAPDLSWLVERDGAIVGTALCERRDGAGYVMDLAVAGAARGTGLGRGLLATALACFRAAGLDGGELWVNGANAPALGLYESLGMRQATRQERWERKL